MVTHGTLSQPSKQSRHAETDVDVLERDKKAVALSIARIKDNGLFEL
jgi:hypothetical protein